MNKFEDFLTIGFSGKITSGKSTMSKLVMNKLVGEQNYKKISFADSLREEVQTLLTSAHENTLTSTHEFFANVPPLQAQYALSLAYKAVIENDDNLPLSSSRQPQVRELMQYWGTDVRRKTNNDYWVEKTLEKIKEIHATKFHVVIDDVRFTNEAAAIINQDYSALVRLDINEQEQLKRLNNRFKGNSDTSKKIDLTHSSETGLDDFPFFDLRINNDRLSTFETSTIIAEEIEYQLKNQQKLGTSLV